LIKINKKIAILSIALFLIIFSVGAAIYLFYWTNNKIQPENKSETSQNMVRFKIYIPESQSIQTREIYMQKENSQLRSLEGLLDSFFREFSSSLRETKILGVYRDRENIIYVDLSKNFLIQGDISGEYQLLKAFYRTLKENFSWISDIKILIEGKEIESISGHFSVVPTLRTSMEDN